MIEIYGPESSGKTTLALHIAAEAQAKVVRDAAEAKPQLRANTYEPWNSEDDGPIESEYF